MESSIDYMVRICRKEAISAAHPFQEPLLSLSNLDLLFPPLDVGAFSIYAKPPLDSSYSTFASMVNVLKASLAKSLDTYYPFAGEVVSNSMGEPELLCNNRGVEFIEAFADVEIAELDFHNVDKTFEGKLLPNKNGGVLTIQATEMKCGGMVLGCTFDHRIADGYSFNMFLISWSEIGSGKQISTIPTFRRSLITPHRPPLRFEPSVDRFFVPISQLPTPTKSLDRISRIYYITAANINRLQQMVTEGCQRRTKLEAFTAYLWKLVGRAAGRRVSQMGVAVDGRKHLGLAMDAYFGNAVSFPYESADVGNKDLKEIAEIVNGFIGVAAREEHFRGLVDWVEVRRPEAVGPRVYLEEGWSVVVSSGRGFPVREMEFAWGKALFGSCYFPWKGNAGYVMPMTTGGRADGDWVIYAYLFPEIVKIIEDDSNGFFEPLTAHYLGIKRC